MFGPATYEHTQPGWLIRIGLGAFLIVLLIMAQTATQWLYLPGGILLICLFLFHSLCVRIDDEFIHLSFGIGIIRRSIPLTRIASCQVTRTPWYFGWGIRYVFNGWMWNVSGFHSVELTYVDEGHFRIGTDEPQALEAAINAAIAGNA